MCSRRPGGRAERPRGGGGGLGWRPRYPGDLVRRASTHTKRRTILVLAVGLVAMLVLTAATIGIGRPSVPDGDVATVDGVEDGEVTDAEFQRAIEQSAAQSGLDQAPPEDDPQFDGVRDQAVQGLLLEIWVEGELDERGIEVSDADVQAQLDQIEQGFEEPKQFQQAVRQAKFCTEEEIAADTPARECEDVQKQARLIAIQQTLSEEFQSEPDVSEDEVEQFYEENISSFEQPASRDVRQIVNEDRAEVEAAAEALDGAQPGDEDFEQRWMEAAAMFSQDQASKDSGGLLEGIQQGQGDPQADKEIFSAEVGELVGPFKSQRGFSLIQVVEDNPAGTQPLEEARPQIRQQLEMVRTQAAAQQAENAFFEKWRARTVCDEVALISFCANFEQPDPEPVPGQPAPPTGPAVQGSAPIEPGTATFSIDGSPQTGAPQRPKQVSDSNPAAMPPGGVPGGLPPGAVPPGAAPPGAVPPGAAPPGAAPPGAVPPGAAPPGAAPPPPQGAPPQGAPPQGAPPPGGGGAP